MIWSPYSVAASLGWVLAGARGTTASELANLLHTSADERSSLAKAIGVHQRLLPRRVGPDTTLRFASAVWAAVDAQFQPEFVLNLGAAYGRGLHRIDFAADPQATGRVINAWVSQQSAGMIPSIIAPNILGPLTRVALVDVLHLKGKWTHLFDVDATEPRRFWIAADRSEQVSTMYRKAPLRRTAIESATIAALPYEGDMLSMLIVLPNALGGLEALENQLSATQFDAWLVSVLQAKPENNVPVYLPKWTTRWSSSLRPTLESIGLNAMFDPGKADLSAMFMAAKQGIHLTDVWHQAVIEVSEDGT